MISHDIYIREQLHSVLAEQWSDGERLIIDELGCCQGAARIDVAVVTNELHGFEIKSERDTLERLEYQTLAYDNVFNTITVVTTEKHLPDLDSILPHWWGIWEAQQVGDGIKFTEHRLASQNPRRNSIHVVSLLWKDEVLGVLRDLGISGAKASATRYELWSLLAESISLAELTEIVTDQLRARGDWRVGVRQRLNGDWLQTGARSSRSRVKLCRSRSPIYIGRPS